MATKGGRLVGGQSGVYVQGLDQLEAKLKRLDGKLQRRTLTRAARKGAKVIAVRARELAPTDTGKLARRGIKVVAVKRRKYFSVAAVGHDRDHFYGAIQEVGADPHPITHKGEKASGKKRGKRRAFMHPGHKAQPHLRPAFDEKVNEATDVVADELKKLLLEAIR